MQDSLFLMLTETSKKQDMSEIKRAKHKAVEVLKEACTKHHPKHAEELHAEVNRFTSLVGQKEGFEEKKVFCFGDVPIKENRLLSNMAFIEEGIPYTIDGVEKIFDSAQHIYEFLQHGIPDQVDKWTRGGVMSCYVGVFGEEKGGKMKESQWKDFLGMIPFILVKPNQHVLRASLGLELRPQKKSMSVEDGGENNILMSMKHYMHWRPVLLAKFGKVPRLRDLLLGTQDLYLLDKEDPKTIARGGGENSNGGCIVYSKPKGSDTMKKEEYEQAKKEGRRVNGKLIGKNRFGRFLMAIRSELTMMSVVQNKKRKAE